MTLAVKDGLPLVNAMQIQPLCRNTAECHATVVSCLSVIILSCETNEELREVAVFSIHLFIYI